MNTTEIFTFLKTWIDTIFSPLTDIDTCTFTNGSAIVTGTDFITDGIVEVGGFVKLTSDDNNFFGKVQSIDSETQLTLVNIYQGSSGTDNGSYTEVYYPTIRGEQNSPEPSDHYFVIHQPMGASQIGSGNYSKANDQGVVNYSIHYETTISIEEVGGDDNGDNLRLLIDSKRRQDIKDLWQANKISLLRNEDVVANPVLTETEWELRSTLDLIILFQNEGSYTPGFIETVEWEGTYQGTVN